MKRNKEENCIEWRKRVCGIGTRVGPSFLEGPSTNNFIFRLILSNNLSYNLYSFVQKLVYLR